MLSTSLSPTGSTALCNLVFPLSLLGPRHQPSPCRHTSFDAQLPTLQKNCLWLLVQPSITGSIPHFVYANSWSFSPTILQQPIDMLSPRDLCPGMPPGPTASHQQSVRCPKDFERTKLLLHPDNVLPHSQASPDPWSTSISVASPGTRPVSVLSRLRAFRLPSPST